MTVIKVCGRCYTNSIFSTFKNTSIKIKKYFGFDICDNCIKKAIEEMEEEIKNKKNYKSTNSKRGGRTDPKKGQG